MNDLGSVRLLDPGKPLAMAISSNYHYSGQQLLVLIVSVNIILGQYSEFIKGQVAVIVSCWNSTQKNRPP